jgi:hypothetical protein
VYVFARDGGGTWTEQAKLTAPDGLQNDFFGEYVALDGDTALVGAPGVDAEGANFEQGAAYVSTRTGSTWSQPARLPAAGGDRNDQFGHGVAIEGDTALVGVPFAEVGSNFDQGAVDVFTRAGDSWQAAGRITAADGAGINRFGFSVAIADSTAVIGAIGAAGGDSSTGAVYVFTQDGGGWSQQAKLAASDGAEFDNFGNAVALAGGRLVVGADFATVGGNTWQGAAYVFERDGDAWSEQAKLTAADGAPFEGFSGNAVAIDGDTVLVGAWLTDVAGNPDQGSAHVYTLEVPDQAPPEIIVDPSGLSVSLDAGDATIEPLTVGNLGEADLSWRVETGEPGCGAPAEVGWLGVAPAAGTTPGGGSSEATVSLDAAGLAAGEYQAALCVASNDPVTPLVEVPVTLTVTAVACDETIVGVHAGPLTVAEGVTCLAAGAQVLGEVNVLAGAGLIATAAVIQGPVSAVGANRVELVFSQVTGPVLVSASTGAVSVFASQVTGSVTLLSNGASSSVSGNTIIGSLSCFGNEPPPTDHGLPNTATGDKLGQCARPAFASTVRYLGDYDGRVRL